MTLRCLLLLSFIITLNYVYIYSAAVADVEYSGAAVTVMLGSPKWFQNRFSIMINQIVVSLPGDWVVQIFYNPTKKMSLEAVNYIGIQKHVRRGKVKLVQIPEHMRKKLRKRTLLLSPFFWESILSERVLLFGGNSALCANSPYTIDDFNGYDLVSGRGVAGLSLRLKSAVLSVIYSNGGTEFAASTTGSEDYVLKRYLKRIAPKEIADKFSVAPDGKGSSTPFSISGVMAELNDTLRTQYIEYCPEIKMLFPVLHSGKCFGAEPQPLECFRFLCEYGGLKCDREKLKEIRWTQSSKKKTENMKLMLSTDI